LLRAFPFEKLTYIALAITDMHISESDVNTTIKMKMSTNLIRRVSMRTRYVGIAITDNTRDCGFESGFNAFLIKWKYAYEKT
jgi:hypothetical protein